MTCNHLLGQSWFQSPILTQTNSEWTPPSLCHSSSTEITKYSNQIATLRSSVPDPGHWPEKRVRDYGVPLSLLESGGSVSSPDPGYNTVHNTPEQVQLCTTSRIQMLCDQTSYRHDLAHHLHTRSFLSPLQATANIQFHWFPGTFHTTVHDDLLIRAIITSAGNFRATSLSGEHAFVACSCSGSDRNSLLK